MGRRGLVLEAPRRLGLEDLGPRRPLERGQVRLRSIASAISHGTEVNLYRGTSPFDGKAFDAELRTFTPTSNGSSYPVRLGYEMVSEVVELAGDVPGVATGDIVHTGTPHQEETVIHAQSAFDADYPLTRLGRGTDPRLGLFISLGSVALQAVHDARIKLGDVVVVSGLGAIGLLAVQMAVLNGAARVIAIDPIQRRRDMAERWGAIALDPADAGAGVGTAVKERNDRAGADIAIETSGAAAALHGAIASVGVGGRVVAVGFYQGDAVGLRLGEEWHHNRPTLISSMGLWGCPHRDHPAWTRRRLTDSVVDLLSGGRVSTEGMLTHTFDFDRAADAYALIDSGSPEVLRIALEY
jgi:2-desacetyl-2-hydroxyethyl bacteriochlorophyllide A dehydrogenase